MKHEPMRPVFVETEKYEEGFTEHYNSYVKPHVESFEEERQKAHQKAKFRTMVSIPIILGTIIITAIYSWDTTNSSADQLKGLGALIIFICAGCSWWVMSAIKTYKQHVKNTIFPNIIKFLGDFDYRPTAGNLAYRHKSSHIVPNYDRESSQDHIKGSYKGVTIDVFESKLERKHYNSKQKRHEYRTIFTGIMICLSMNKSFNGITILKRDRGRLLNYISSKFESLETIKLEDPRFEKIFEVYGSDQIEARYLLTTALMQRILDLAEVLKSNKIECSFYNDKLLIMVPLNDDFFEPGPIYEPETFVDDAKMVLKEMNLLFQIIDTLKLNQQTGL